MNEWQVKVPFGATVARSSKSCTVWPSLGPRLGVRSPDGPPRPDTDTLILIVCEPSALCEPRIPIPKV